MANISGYRWLIGDEDTTQTLTDTYTKGSDDLTIDVAGNKTLVVYAQYTPKNGETDRNMYVKVEFSYDGGDTWIPLSTVTDGSDSSGVIEGTMSQYELVLQGPTGGTTYGYRHVIDLGDDSVSGCLVRVRIKEDGQGSHGAGKVGASWLVT
jgi:hypothetical protein